MRQDIVPIRLDAAVLKTRLASVAALALVEKLLDLTETLLRFASYVEVLCDFVAQMNRVDHFHEKLVLNGETRECKEGAVELLRFVQLNHLPVRERPPELVDEHHPLLWIHGRL